MARGRKKSTNKIHSTVKRDILNSIASPRLLNRTNLVRSQQQVLLDIARLGGQSNRTYSPVPKRLRSPKLIRGRTAPTSMPKNTPIKMARYEFTLPKETTVCVRRGVRKEVLHALKRTSKGSGAKRRRLNSNSRIKC